MNESTVEEVLLHGFGPAFGNPDPSPFPMKVMLFLKLHDIPHRVQVGDPRKAPLGKVPYITHRGQDIPDSELILDYLTDTFDLQVDTHLSDEQRAVGHAVCRTLEERFYWAMVYSRWATDESWPALRDKFFGQMPSLVRVPLATMIRRKVLRDLNGHGLGRHRPENIFEFAGQDLGAVAALLGDKQWLFGDRPSRADCSVHAFIAQAAQTEMPTPLNELVNRHPNLLEYWERIRGQFYS